MKILFHFILSCLLYFSGYAQPYHTFMHDTAVWTEWEATLCCEPGQAALSFEVNFIMMGDTAINGPSYKKVYYQQIDAFSFGVCPPGFPNLQLHLTGFIREDSSGKVFYLANPANPPPVQCAEENFTTEKILYDFGVNTGDSVSWKPYNNLVMEVDSVQAPNGEFLKRIKFDNQQDFWIESLGSAFAFFGSYMPPPFECGCNLECAQAVDLLPSDSPPPCGGIVNTVKDAFQSIRLNVYPNPFCERFSLISPFQSRAVMVLMNSMGETIFEKNLQPFEKISFDKTEVLPNGLVFIRLISEQGISQTAVALKQHL
jgi:hypothetical protein